MKQILIFGGTTEGRRLAEIVCKAGIACTVCVATEYGEHVMDARGGLTLHQGRMSAEEMKAFIAAHSFTVVVDATHPFAAAVSRNIKTSLIELGIPYIRLKRNTEGEQCTQGNSCYFPNVEACAEALNKVAGNILLTTGSKDLNIFCRKQIKERLYVRVLPSIESIALCEKQGIKGKQVIAMQGPFTEEMNQAIMKQYKIACLVTKESGSIGGFFEKRKAAENLGVKVMVIGNPEKQEEGISFTKTVQRVEKLLNTKLLCPQMHISLIGMGMGSEMLLTQKAIYEIQKAEVLFGAKRLLENVPEEKEKYPYYLAADILPRIRELSSRGIQNIAVLFSGDTGFYSGTEKLLKALKKQSEAEITVVPGISSVSYLAAKTGISWNDAAIFSMHGRKCNVLGQIMNAKKSFILVSGLKDMKRIGQLCCQAGLTELKITAGYQLSYPEEKIIRLTPSECLKLKKEGFYCCLIENENAGSKKVTHGLADDFFIRSKVPMTKEEVRAVSICKLNLTKESILYDVGSGTGSVAVECARLSSDICVYAIERKPEALRLIEQNCIKAGLENVTVIPGEAPEGLQRLPVPTHAFIGGSGGKMAEILKTLYKKNPFIQIVINAISLETISEIMDIMKEFPIHRKEVVQVQVSRSREVKGYHLMQGENPVYICSFEGNGGTK